MRKKVAGLVILFLAILFALGKPLAKNYILSSYEEIERQSIKSDLERIQYSVDHEVEYLSNLTADWSMWDDTYHFMQFGNQDYLDSNLVDGTFIELGLNFMLFFNPDGEIFYQKAFDLHEEEEISLPDEVTRYFKLLISNDQNGAYEKEISGLAKIGDKVILFASQPILTSNETGPSRGSLVFGKNLEGSLFEHIANTVDLPLRLNIEPEKELKWQSLASKDSQISEFYYLPNDQTISGQLIFHDAQGEPVLKLFFNNPRTIYQQGMKTINDFWIYLTISGIMGCAIILFFLDKLVLSRVQALSRYAATGGRQNNLVSKSPIGEGKDEINHLGQEMEKAFFRLEQNKLEIEQHLRFEKVILEMSTRFINLPVKEIESNIDDALASIGKFTGADRTYLFLEKEDNPDLVDNTHEWCSHGTVSFQHKFQGVSRHDLSWWFTRLELEKFIHISEHPELPESAQKEKDLFKNRHIKSLIAVPIIKMDRVIGFLGCESITKITDWNRGTSILLFMVGNILTNALDRKNIETEILHNHNVLSQLNNISKTSLQASNLAEAKQVMASQIKKLIKADNCTLVLVGDNDWEDTHIDSLGQGKEIRLIIDQLIDHFSKNKWDHLICQVHSNENFENLIAVSLNAESCLVLPLKNKKELVGFAIAGFKKRHVFLKTEVEMLKQAAIQITLALIKIKALQVSEKRTQELFALRATIADITSELSTNRLIEIILNRVIELLKVDGGEICQYDQQIQALKVIASNFLGEDYLGTVIKPGEGIAGCVLEKREIVVIDDYSTWEGRMPIYDGIAIRSTMATPMIIGDRMLGTISVFKHTPEKNFSDEDQMLLNLFAQHAAIALENAALFEKSEHLARIDEVSGLLNRRALKGMGDKEINRARRLNSPISVALLDMDNFKVINDRCGHLAGDHVIRFVASLCQKNLRDFDIVGRFGGDELLIIMPETNLESSRMPLERLRRTIETTPIIFREEVISVTVSIGINSAETVIPDFETMVKNADIGMYLAKKNGGNCMVVNQQNMEKKE